MKATPPPPGSASTPRRWDYHYGRCGMSDTATRIDPAAALDALSEHPAYATLARHLHPSMAGWEIVIPDAADWSALEVATLVAILAGKHLVIVSDDVFRLAHRVLFARKVANAVGHFAHNAPVRSGVALRFTEVAR